MRFHLQILILLVSGMFLNSAVAGGIALKDRDCTEILKRWAADPNSVPQSLVDTCQEKLAAALPDMNPAAGSAVDPCAGPNSANLINCWGPWAALAPAAGDAVAPIVLAKGDPNLRPDEFTRDPAGDGGVPLPLGSCAAGAPCGFATVVDGNLGVAAAADTEFRRFDMAQDGTSFVVDPGGADQITSVNGMQTRFSTIQGTEVLRAFGTNGTEASGLISRVYRYGGNDIQIATELWQHNGNTLQSGNFAWGIATPQNGLDALNAGNVTVNFSGRMSVDDLTQAQMTVNFGAQPNWTGSWVNPGYTFDAGGRVFGVDLISNPAQFSANVQAGVVQGGLVGQTGSLGVVHNIDVTLDTIGQVKDVGLLLQ